MEISKTKLAAVSFSAALTSLYVVPELGAQDSVPDVVDLMFMPGTVPLSGGPNSTTDFTSAGVQVFFGGLSIEVRLLNNGYYGFAGLSASAFVTGLQPGDVFSGGGEDEVGNFSFGPMATGIQTIGFVIAGEVGFFRVDLGDEPGSTVTLLDGQIAVGSDGTDATNDFAITIPPRAGDEPIVLRGDVNLDGMVNFLDIAPFISRLAEMENQPEADVNEDGVVNFLDISPFIGVLANPSSMQVSWSDSTGKPLERFAAGNEVLDQQLQAIERKLQDELNTALAQSNSSAVESESASVGLAALALGAAGLRRRRKAATAV